MKVRRSRVCIFIARWGNWPSFTHLLLKTLAANDSLDFVLLSEAAPGARLPPNVRFLGTTLEELTSRLRRTIGLQLDSLSVATRTGGWSSAKVNDLKPMFGEAFADVLTPYEWWGYLQEDVLLGRLQTVCLPPEALNEFDVITPFMYPLNSSGIFMLYRNKPAINRMWRSSSDAQTVLSESSYMVFDEWWGKSRDHMPAVIGRQVEAKRVRVSYGTPFWYASDNRAAFEPVICWRDGVFLNSRLSGPERLPCLGNTPSSLQNASLTLKERVGVCIFHMAEMKKVPEVANLRLSAVQEEALAASEEMAITRSGLWLPWASLSKPADSKKDGDFVLLSSRKRGSVAHTERFEPVSLRLYLARLRRCVDMAAHPRLRELLHPSRGWCWKRYRERACEKSPRVRALCTRTCGACGLLGCQGGCYG